MKPHELLSLLMMGALASGCDDPAETENDTATDVALDQPGSCRQEQDPLNPHYRMTYLDLQSPPRMNNPVLEDSILNEALRAETILWLVRFSGVDDGVTDTDGVMNMQMGGGEVEEIDHQGCYQFSTDPDYPAATSTLEISGDDFTWPSDDTTIDLDIPVFWWDYTFLMKLPLKDGRITSGSFSTDRSTIGEVSGDSWSCGANITGVITLADAREVYIPSMTQHLCAILSGAVGDASDPDDDCEGDPGTWPDPPDTTLDGQPAYSLTACFAAEQVIVID